MRVFLLLDANCLPSTRRIPLDQTSSTLTHTQTHARMIIQYINKYTKPLLPQILYLYIYI